MYALSVVRSSPRPPIDAAVRVSRSIVAVRPPAGLQWRLLVAGVGAPSF
jgi:hypothetical protein